MIVVCGYDHYSSGHISIDKVSIRDHDYVAILNALLECNDRLYSYTMLIYTIVRYLYPHRKVSIEYGAEASDDDLPMTLDLFYLSYDWNGDNIEGYITICSADQLMDFVADDNLWRLEDLIESMPDIEDRLDELMSDYVAVTEIEPIGTDKYNIDPDDASYVIGSISLIKQYELYVTIFTELPPYPCGNRSRRYVNTNSDVDFIFPQ